MLNVIVAGSIDDETQLSVGVINSPGGWWKWRQAIALLLGLTACSLSYAESYRCVREGDARVINLEYPGRDNLCEVTANHEDGTRKVVWLANGGSQFCSTKITELIGKYRNQWNWNCEPVASRTQLDTLSIRERLFLDDLVKSVVQQGRRAEPAFVVSSVRSFSDQAEPKSLLVVQMVIDASDGSAGTDRVYLVAFNDEGYQLEALQVGLDRLVMPDDRISGQALVTQMNEDRSFSVRTIYEQPNSASSESARACVGEAVLKPGADGKLTVSGEPKVACE